MAKAKWAEQGGRAALSGVMATAVAAAAVAVVAVRSVAVAAAAVATPVAVPLAVVLVVAMVGRCTFRSGSDLAQRESRGRWDRQHCKPRTKSCLMRVTARK